MRERIFNACISAFVPFLIIGVRERDMVALYFACGFGVVIFSMMLLDWRREAHKKRTGGQVVTNVGGVHLDTSEDTLAVMDRDLGEKK